jgi:uncharacterized repeat protein (TIGR01451 family)
MHRSIIWAGLIGVLVFAAAARGQYPMPPQTPEPPLADDAKGSPAEQDKRSPAPTEPGTIQPAVFNQALPLQQPTGELPTPVVTINVVASDTAAVGAEVPYRIVVQNRSTAKAHHVLVRCAVPKNAAFVKSTPQPSAEQPDLQWELETLDPQASRTIELTFQPNEGESEIRVLARVQFDHGQWVRTQIAKPGLALKKIGPREGVLYDDLSYRIEVTNTGKVAVRDARVTDQLPDGMEYETDESSGSTIDREKNQRTWKLARLGPGEKRTLEYRAIAKKTGPMNSMTEVVAGNVRETAPFKATILEARLELKLDGPKDGAAFVNQPAAYQLAVRNTGTATLNNVRVTCTFPSDVRLARASNGAQFFKDAVQWIVPKLNAGESRTLTFHLTAPSGGIRKVSASVRADRGLEQTADLSTDFQGITALNWDTEGTSVASVGKEIKYTITVRNTGSAEASNVQVRALLPPQVEFRDQANPPFRYRERAIVFDPIRIPPRRSATYTLTVTAKQKGEALFRFELLADHMRSGSAAHEKTTAINGDPNPIDPKDVPSKKDNGQIG